MAGDPYSARGWPREAAERRGELAQFLQRLRELGATADELVAVEDHWDDFDDPAELADEDRGDAWTPDRRYAMTRAGDHELVALLRSVRAEYEVGTVSEGEAAERDAARRAERARVEAYDRMGGTVTSIVAWVADDEVRAGAVLAYETGPDGAHRKSLLAALNWATSPA